MSDVVNAIVFDEDLADAQPPALLADGKYLGEVRSAQVKMNKNAEPMLVLNWVISVDQFPADFPDADAYPQGYPVSSYHTATNEKSRKWQFRRLLINLGMNPKGFEFAPEDFVGKVARITIRATPGNDDTMRQLVQNVDPV